MRHFLKTLGLPTFFTLLLHACNYILLIIHNVFCRSFLSVSRDGLLVFRPSQYRTASHAFGQLPGPLSGSFQRRILKPEHEILSWHGQLHFFIVQRGRTLFSFHSFGLVSLGMIQRAFVNVKILHMSDSYQLQIVYQPWWQPLLSEDLRHKESIKVGSAEPRTAICLKEFLQWFFFDAWNILKYTAARLSTNSVPIICYCSILLVLGGRPDRSPGMLCSAQLLVPTILHPSILFRSVPCCPIVPQAGILVFSSVNAFDLFAFTFGGCTVYSLALHTLSIAKVTAKRALFLMVLSF